MKRCAPVLLSLLALVILLQPTAALEARDISGSTWYEGASGFEQAIEQARENEQPMMVYFRTEWCGYCRQFERELLATDEVGIFIDKIVRVTIDPEAGQEEMEIASAYNVRGYPAIFMHAATLQSPEHIQRMRMLNGKPRLQTPLEFVQTLSLAAHK